MMMNIVSLQIDHDSVESTLSNSFHSGFSVECLSDADSKMDVCDDWTNEKHNLYLDGLENSFVRQLHSLLGGETRRLSKTRGVQSNSRKSTSQFKVVQSKCLQKSKRRGRFGTAVQGHVLCKEEVENFGGDKACYCTRTPVRNFLEREYPAQNIAEAGGRNFKEGEEETECVSQMATKRSREANCDDSSLKDQVVP